MRTGEKKISRKLGSRHCVHYALVRTVAFRGGGHIHPLVPVTHAMWAAGRNLVTERRKKFVGMHAAAEGRKSSLRLCYRDFLLHGYDITQLPLLTFNESSLLCVRRIHWQLCGDKSCSWQYSPEK